MKHKGNRQEVTLDYKQRAVVDNALNADINTGKEIADTDGSSFSVNNEQETLAEAEKKDKEDEISKDPLLTEKEASTDSQEEPAGNEPTVRKINNKKKLKMKHFLLAFLSVFLICIFIVSIYIWKILDAPTHTNVPIVTGGEVSEGILDSLAETNENEGASILSASSFSGADNVTPVFLTWGNGRVKLYVNANFPITKVEQKDPNVENILLIGVDARSSYETQSRTDSIIVVSIDKNNNSIKLTSFMRDTQVKIPGRTNPTKINSAYEFGGIGLLINTMNINFGLDIQKFAMVDMLSAENVINAAGGVIINVMKDEIERINVGVAETNNLFRNFSSFSHNLTNSGLQLLDGRQAVSYGRIRYIGSDTARTQRQRTVLTALIVSFKASSANQKMKVFETGFSAFETNMTKSDMLFLAFDVLAGMKNIQQYRVPQDGMYTTNLSNYQIIIDYAKQIPALYQFIWGNSSNPLVTMSAESSSSLNSSAGSSLVSDDISSSSASNESSFTESSISSTSVSESESDSGVSSSS